MALTIEGRSLTEAHRLAQGEIAAETVRDVSSVWRSRLDLRRIEATFPAFFAESLDVLDRDHFRSAALSSAYLEAFHEAEGVATVPLDLQVAGDLAREQALSSLFWTGPAYYRGAVSKGVPVAKAEDVALSQAAKAALRLSLQGGRATVSGTVRRSGSIRGIARVTDGQPCSFCAMLASRGAVYKSDSFTGSDARFKNSRDGVSSVVKVHDGCGCQPEPVYARDGYKAPGRSDEFLDVWKSIPGGLSPADQRRAFRGLYETGKVPKKYLDA